MLDNGTCNICHSTTFFIIYTTLLCGQHIVHSRVLGTVLDYHIGQVLGLGLGLGNQVLGLGLGFDTQVLGFGLESLVLGLGFGLQVKSLLTSLVEADEKSQVVDSRD